MYKLAELLAKNLERIRTEMGLSKSEFARLAEIAQPTMSLYLHAKREDVGLGTIDTLAKNLKCEPWDLIRPDDIPKAPNVLAGPHTSDPTFFDGLELLAAFRSGSPALRKFVMALLTKDVSRVAGLGLDSVLAQFDQTLLKES